MKNKKILLIFIIINIILIFTIIYLLFNFKNKNDKIDSLNNKLICYDLLLTYDYIENTNFNCDSVFKTDTWYINYKLEILNNNK